MQEIGLQEFIEQIRKELLELGKSPDPIFFIDKVELELTVKVTRQGNGQIQVTVLSFAGASLGGSKGDERGHVVRISLSPLMTREDIYKEVVRDEATKEYLMKYMKRAFTKSDGMVGDI
jgi:hypothetical protein